MILFIEVKLDFHLLRFFGNLFFLSFRLFHNFIRQCGICRFFGQYGIFKLFILRGIFDFFALCGIFRKCGCFRGSISHLRLFVQDRCLLKRFSFCRLFAQGRFLLHRIPAFFESTVFFQNHVAEGGLLHNFVCRRVFFRSKTFRIFYLRHL